jgi:hypothetical protein
MSWRKFVLPFEKEVKVSCANKVERHPAECFMGITGPCSVDSQKFAKAFNELRPTKLVFERGQRINRAC